MSNQRYTNAHSFSDNWRIDKDGFLSITARVLADGVFNYSKEESPEATAIGGMIPHYIPAQEFTAEALKTLEGKPVIIGDHDWRTSQNTLTDGMTVGNVAGAPRFEDRYIVADLLITDKAAIDKITNKELVEISAAYNADAYPQDGEHKGKRFSVIQKNLRFNHILLLPVGHGRCGRDVKIINKTIEEKTMSINVQRVFNGKNGKETRNFTFSNEDDRREAEKMAEAVKDEMTFDNDGLKAAERVRELNSQLSSLQNERDEALKVVDDLRKKLDELTSAEAIDSLVDEARAQDDATDAILEDAVMNEVIEEKEKEEIKNTVKACNSLHKRREKFMELILPKYNMPVQNMNSDMLYGAFMQLARTATTNLQRAQKNTAPTQRLPMGGVIVNNSASKSGPDRGIAAIMQMSKDMNARFK